MTRDSPRVGIFDADGTLAGSNLVTAHLARVFGGSYDTTVMHRGEPGSLARLSTFFDIDLPQVREQVLEDYVPVPARPSMRRVPRHLWRLLVTQGPITAPYDLFVCSAGYSLPPVSRAGFSVVYCHFPYASIDAETGGEGASSPGRIGKAKQFVFRRILALRISSYDLVLANSEYTATWIRHRWSRSADVLYPPVSADPPRLDKENLIVSVGRFDPQDTKNHTATIEAFKRFVDRGPRGDWRLCIMGSIGDSPAARTYLHSLRDQVADYRVDLETNLARKELLRRLARAKLYWHSKGLGAGTAPAYQEHFGISTVEAMRARCVPVVPDAGGQPEIVTHGQSGFLCDDVEGMVDVSLGVSADSDSMSRMARTAHRRSLAFSVDGFEERLRALLPDRWKF